jgi:hypothetical protein
MTTSTSGRSRLLENVGFLIGIANATLYTLGVKLGVAEPATWAVVVLNATLIAPKMLGRASAGRIWDAIAGRFGGRVNGSTTHETAARRSLGADDGIEPS